MDRTKRDEAVKAYRKCVWDERRAYCVICGELELGMKTILAPDCSDILCVLHRPTDPEAETPLDACVGRYFERATQLLLLPAWAYEVLEYFHRSTRHLDSYVDVGIGAFFANYKEANRFRELWREGKIREATKLYSDARSWKQVLAFSNSENVNFMLRAPLKRMRELIEAGKFTRIGDYIGAAEPLADPDMYEAVSRSLASIRKADRDAWKNGIDAHSIATVYALDARGYAAGSFSAITTTRACREAYYRVLDARQAPLRCYAFVRSPLVEPVKEQAARHMRCDALAYLRRAIESAEKVCALLDQMPRADFELGPHLALDEDQRAAYFLEQELDQQVWFYDKVFSAPLHSTLRRVATPPSAGFLPQPLSEQEAFRLLESDRLFREQMSIARDEVCSAAREGRDVMDRTSSYVTSGGGVRVAGKHLSEIVDRFRKDYDALCAR